MNRREFLTVGAGATVATDASPLRWSTSAPNSRQDDYRASFPRLSRERYINAAGGTPLGTFAQAGLQRYMEFQRLGPGGGREDYVTEMRTIVPINVRELGIDFAACNGYKWLCGVHGAGFLFVREELQGSALPDRLFPGHVRYNYPPWVREADPRNEALIYTAQTDASRYEPGHVSYLGYCAVYEGLRFLDRVGIQQTLDHSVRLCRRLKDQLDTDQYECISPHVDRSPIIAFIRHDGPDLEERLRAAGLVVTLGGNRVRVSPAIYNTDEDIDILAEVLNA